MTAYPRRALLRKLTQSFGALPLGLGPTIGSTTSSANTAPRSVQFALIGDLPYSESGVARASRLFDQINNSPLDFVIHVGDLKDGRSPCTDALWAHREALLERCRHPLILLPGDNDWTDCHRRSAGGYDPQERLQALRTRFWSRPKLLGGNTAAYATLNVQRQPDYPENIRWRIGALHGVAVHVVGSDNGLDQYPGSREEFTQRQHANTAWLTQSLADARQHHAAALLIAFHANPDFEALSPRPGHAEHLQALQTMAERFPGPIMLVHGDTHHFRVDRPLRNRRGQRFPQVTRVESFGHPFDQAWVHIAWQPNAPHPFKVTPQSGFS
jgi:hypothetical protein